MFKVFRAILDRIKAFLVTQGALEFEADFLAQQAERQAHLFRLAERYETEGLPIIAENLRRQAQALDIHQPLVVALPAITPLPGGVQVPHAADFGIGSLNDSNSAGGVGGLPALNRKGSDPPRGGKRMG